MIRQLRVEDTVKYPADRERTTRRRQKAVELLLAQGYHWHDGEWIAPAPAIDLEQFRRFIHACGYGAGAFPERTAEADRLLTLIDVQANVRSSSEHSS